MGPLSVCQETTNGESRPRLGLFCAPASPDPDRRLLPRRSVPIRLSNKDYWHYLPELGLFCAHAQPAIGFACHGVVPRVRTPVPRPRLGLKLGLFRTAALVGTDR